MHALRRSPLTSRASGFTLVELMVTIAILAIVAGIAIPNLSDFIAGQRVRMATSDLFGTLLYARSEGIKRNTTIKVTRSGTTWDSGWSVTNNDGTLTFKRQDAYNGITINLSDSTLSSVTFGGNGRPTAGSAAVTFTAYSTTKPGLVARCVSLNLAGMPSVKVDSDSDKTNGC